VTLKKKGELRGCIGRMIGDEPLVKIVGVMAIQAAFNDRRFNQLTADELSDIEIEISVLTPMKKVSGAGDIVVGRDGVLINKDGYSAVFLPQVATEQKWNREEMLDNLCLKAGLTAGCWKEKAQFSTFQAVVFSESQFKRPHDNLPSRHWIDFNSGTGCLASGIECFLLRDRIDLSAGPGNMVILDCCGRSCRTPESFPVN
jgi:AmmeMemoRadiSam system protein A